MKICISCGFPAEQEFCSAVCETDWARHVERMNGDSRDNQPVDGYTDAVDLLTAALAPQGAVLDEFTAEESAAVELDRR